MGTDVLSLIHPHIPSNSEYLLGKKPNIRYSDIWLFHCGATRIRTGDTRIFSPMLYLLSYGTIINFAFQNPLISFAGAKLGIFLILTKFFQKKIRNIIFFTRNSCHNNIFL